MNKILSYNALSKDAPGLSATFYFKKCNLACCYCYNLKTLKNRVFLDVEEAKQKIKSLVKDFKGKQINQVDWIVFSGGECTLYEKELIELLKYAKDLNFKTCVYTNGLLPLVVEKIEPYTDLFSIDFKVYSPLDTSTVLGKDISLSDYCLKLKETIVALKNTEYNLRTVLIKPYVTSDLMLNYVLFLQTLEHFPQEIHFSNVLINKDNLVELSQANKLNQAELDDNFKNFSKLVEATKLKTNLLKHYLF